MIKTLLLLIFISINQNLLANDAIVIVFQAPLLARPDLNSKVLQYIRYGEKIYVSIDNQNLSKKNPEFYETFDRAGNAAFIPSKYIKPITNDERENLKSISFGKHDPTDYRLEEPIPATYPYENASYLKASFSLSIGNNIKSPYDYQKSLTSQNYGNEYGGRFLINKKVPFDKYDRFYFGTIIIISSFKTTYLFTDATQSVESRSMIRIGPYLSFDIFSNKNLKITLGTGFTYNYHKTSIQQTKESENLSEERFFTGFSLSPLISSYVQIEDIFPAFDVILGTDITLYPDRLLKATSNSEIPTLWNSNNIHEELKPQATLYLGAQFKY